MRKRELIRRPICPLHYAGSSRLVVIGEKLPILGQLLDSHPFLDWWRVRFRSRRKREKQCNQVMLSSFANSYHLLFDVVAHYALFFEETILVVHDMALFTNREHVHSVNRQSDFSA